ncbi:hypothetical protein F2Q69_00021464 [Brassica cretica]|uniref:Uncharacterized protein n=1 Tax=Brassica cretica TaxID=69181 RepID=A0A8S9QGJ1_BRACR|nr:hypothetical protein F2Q69_00021464 [Brassica cretica]
MRGLMSYRCFGRARSLRSDRAPARARSLRSDRVSTRARSLRSDRVSTRARSLRSDRALARTRSLRSDRAEHLFVRCVATLFELLSDDSRFLRKAFRAHELIMFFRPFFVGGEHLLKLLERRGVGWCVGRGYVRCGSVEISATASVKRSLHVIRVVSLHVWLSVMWLRVRLIRIPLHLAPNCGNRNSDCRFPFKLGKLENPSFPEFPDIC